MFTPEELRQAKIFACLDEAECARMAQNAADVRLKAGEGSLVLRALRRATAQSPIFRGYRRSFLSTISQQAISSGKFPFCYALPSLTQHERKHPAASHASISSSFFS